MKTLLVDLNNMLHRAESKYPDMPHMTVLHVASLVGKFHADYVFLVGEGGTPAFRKMLVPDYKLPRRRNANKERIGVFIEFARKAEAILNNFYQIVRIDGFEADDVIAGLAEELQGQVIIASMDRDYFQLISEDVSVYFGNRLYDVDKFINEFGFTPDKYIVYKSLVGDSSDNVKGVYGIGDKTARKLLKQINNIDELFEYCKKSKSSKLRQASKQREAFDIAYCVMKIPPRGVTECIGRNFTSIFGVTKRPVLDGFSEWTQNEILQNLQTLKNIEV